MTVEDILEPADAAMATVVSDKPLLEVIQTLEQKGLHTLAVVRENGALVGLLEKASIQALLQNREAQAA